TLAWRALATRVSIFRWAPLRAAASMASYVWGGTHPSPITGMTGASTWRMTSSARESRASASARSKAGRDALEKSVGCRTRRIRFMACSSLGAFLDELNAHRDIPTARGGASQRIALAPQDQTDAARAAAAAPGRLVSHRDLTPQRETVGADGAGPVRPHPGPAQRQPGIARRVQLPQHAPRRGPEHQRGARDRGAAPASEQFHGRT